MLSSRATLGTLLLAHLAATGLPASAAGDTRALSAGLSRYREAHEALATGDFARAQTRFESLPQDFILADYAAFFAAESLLRAGHEAAAFERFRAFSDSFPGSVLVPEALLAAHDAAFRLARWPDAERVARRFLARALHHPEAGRLLVRLAEARAAQGLVAEAIGDLRRRWIEAPASAWGEAAREILEDLAAFHGLPVPPLTGEEQYLRALRLAEANELMAAVKGLGELLAQESETELRHRALVRLVPVLGRLQRGPEGIALLQAALADPPTAWRDSLLYELARLLRRNGQVPDAVAVLERLLAERPDPTLASEAWLALARARLELRQPEARATYQALIRAYPTSLAAGAATWELAWLDYQAGGFRDAALAFRQLGAAGLTYRLAGLYWAARSLEAVSEPGAAAALYREILVRAPHSYYGILAGRRIRGTPPAPVAASVRLPGDPIALLEPELHFQKGRALWSLGFDEHALLELETLGRDGLVEGDRAWGLGFAFAQIGEAGRSLGYLRRAFGTAAEAGAPGLTREFWRLFYPLGYADLVRAAARRAGLDPFFVAAVIREESSYDPRARSWVGAVGLMQLMPDTARVVAAETGVPLTEPSGLWDPSLNIALGTHYLGQLRARFQEPLLVAASYNAGPHRVQRWVVERRTADLEEFVELIPFDETRAFVKRVYASWRHYRRLYGTAEGRPRPGEAEATPRGAR